MRGPVLLSPSDRRLGTWMLVWQLVIVVLGHTALRNTNVPVVGLPDYPQALESDEVAGPEEDIASQEALMRLCLPHLFELLHVKAKVTHGVPDFW